MHVTCFIALSEFVASHKQACFKRNVIRRTLSTHKYANVTFEVPSLESNFSDEMQS